VQHADAARLQVAQAPVIVEQLAVAAAIQADGHGVDGEIAPVEILLDRGAFDLRQLGRALVELGARGDKVERGRHAGGRVLVEDDLGGAEARMAAHPRAERAGEFLGHADGVPLDDEIQIQRRRAEQEVAHEPADDVQGIAHAVRHVPRGDQERAQTLRQGLLHAPPHTVHLGGIGAARAGRDDVRTGDDADEGAVLHHGHLAEVVLDHHPLDLFDRVVRVHVDGAGVHQAADGHLLQAVMQGAVDIAAGQHADQAVAVHDGKALVPVAAHQGGRLPRGHVRPDGVHIGGHDGKDGRLRSHLGGEEIQQGSGHGGVRAPGHQRGGGLRVPAPTEGPQDSRHVDGLRRRAGDDLHIPLALGEQEAAVRVVRGGQLVDEARQFVDIIVQHHGGDADAAALDGVELGSAGQARQDLPLGGSERRVQELVRHAEVGAVLQEPGGGVGIARGSGEVGEGARVLIDAHQEKGGPDGRQRCAAGADALDQQGAGGAGRLGLDGGALRRGLIQVVVDDMDRRARAHAAQRGDGVRVHQGDVRDRPAGQGVPLDEGERVRIERQKGAQVAVQLDGQDRHGLGSQQPGAVHGGQGVHVRALVRGDDLHAACRSHW